MLPEQLRFCIPAPQVLHEKEIELKPFWQLSLLHSMFFTSHITEFER